jgi:DegV family protein with EDD domain
MNMEKIAIVTDSSAYIPPDALAGLDVTVIPLWLIWEDESLRDGVDIDPPRFYQRLRTAKSLPTTSQPTPDDFMNVFKRLAEKADAIVAVLLSSKISGTHASAVMAQNQMQEANIRIVDSKSSSMGLGFSVLAAAQAAAKGMLVDEVVAAAEAMRDKLHFFFMVDTLDFLYRSGRIKATKRLLGTILKIKPMLQFKDGLIQSLASERTMGKAITRMLDIAEEHLGGKRMAEAAVVDIDCPERGNRVAEMIKERFSPQKILRSEVSPLVGNVVGPGAFGIAFYPEG